MRIMKSFIVFSLLSGLLWTSQAQAQVKIATVNMKQVFDNYWKTKEISASLTERERDYKAKRETMLEDFEKANNDYRVAREGATDQAVSTSERERRKKEAEEAFVQVKTIEQNIRDFDNSTRSQLLESKKRLTNSIVQDIREEIAKMAKANGYALVLDTAAEGISQTPVLLYSDGSSDITKELQASLNASEAAKP